MLMFEVISEKGSFKYTLLFGIMCHRHSKLEKMNSGLSAQKLTHSVGDHKLWISIDTHTSW